MEIRRIHKLEGELSVPGDKSISHRSVMLAALSDKTTTIRHFLQGADCLSTIACFEAMGIRIDNDPSSDTVRVYGQGLHGLKAPVHVLDAGNSGTTTRLLSGILAGQPFISTLTGDASIQKRPMRRIMTPLLQMGAQIESLGNNDCAPLRICGGSLQGIHYHSPVASAQVKSAILLAGLYAEGLTAVTEPMLSRNHTELMLRACGATINCTSQPDGSATASVLPVDRLYAPDITVPGDISSAAYFLTAGLLTPNSRVTVKNVGINPTRDGFLRVCRQMGGNLYIENEHLEGSELTADITAVYSQLHATTVEGALIPTLIDEIPVISVLACFADGVTTIRDAKELKVKESNRIDVMTKALTAMGASVTATDDGMIIEGGKPLHGAAVDTCSDHRIAMSAVIAAINSDGCTTLSDSDCVRISYPGFFTDLSQLVCI